MYVDSQFELSNSQAVTATAISENVVDILSTAGPAATLGAYTTTNSLLDLGQSNEPVYLVVQTSVACTSGGAATLTITLESDDNVSLSSSTVHFSTAALALAAFQTAGTRLVTLALPHGDYQRYLGLRYTVGTANLTAGAFDAFLTTDPAGVRRTYATGFVVQ